MPSCTQRIASLIIGMSTLFDTNPGESLTSTGVLPSVVASSTVFSTVSFDVFLPRITSTSSMTGTGFMKCIPMTWAGRLVCAASVVIEMDEVLEARIVSPGATRSRSRKILNLISGFSVAASTTKWAVFTSSNDVLVRIRSSTPTDSETVTVPFLTCRSKFCLIV